MFCFDVETLDVESTCVILSAAIVYFDIKDKPSYNNLLLNTFFVKLDAKDQVKRLGRTVSQSTITEFWNKQSKEVQAISLYPYETDLKAEDAIESLRAYIKSFPSSDSKLIWARGSLDQMSIDSLAKKAGLEPITRFNLWRDVRTGVDLLTGSKNGYSKVNHPEFNREDVKKHDPRHDVCFDVMQLLYGVSNVQSET